MAVDGQPHEKRGEPGEQREADEPDRPVVARHRNCSTAFRDDGRRRTAEPADGLADALPPLAGKARALDPAHPAVELLRWERPEALARSRARGECVFEVCGYGAARHCPSRKRPTARRGYGGASTVLPQAVPPARRRRLPTPPGSSRTPAPARAS